MIIYGKKDCFYCKKAVELAGQLGIDFTYHDVAADDEKMLELKTLVPTARSVPQIFVGSEHIGGYDQFAKLVADHPENVAKWTTTNS